MVEGARLSRYAPSRRSAVAEASLDQGFLPAAFLYVGKREATEWQVALDIVVRVSDSYPVLGHMRVGGASTFWGRWRDNDRLRMFLRFDF